MSLDGSKTAENLQAAFALESQSSCRSLYWADLAEGAGRGDIGMSLRATAETERGFALGSLDVLRRDEAAGGAALVGLRDALDAALSDEAARLADTYPGMARVARDEGFDEIAQWFEALAKAKHARAMARRLPGAD
jgi:rubrerythrin